MPGDRTPMRQALETRPLALHQRWSQREMSLFLGVSQRTASAHHRRFTASVLRWSAPATGDEPAASPEQPDPHAQKVHRPARPFPG
jgi:hypothetical protein